MAKVKGNRPQSSKKAKKGFVLSIGDEGAILTHFDKGTLVNRVFVDSPFSPDIKLMKKLFELYPRLPITVYVDIIEQNYVHANLPPLGSSAVKKQAQRKLDRDFQPNDLNNYIPIGREKEGRKDWKFLFISLANAEPFTNWIDLVMDQKNKLNGIYVLAIESQQMINELNSKIVEKPSQEWELTVMHNKVSGFRITAFRKGKIYFTRLTQHVIGENIAEVVAGNLEHEITNTIEYLKRLGFSSENDAHISIIANEEVLKKLELSRMNFGKVDKYTPYSAAEKLNITYAVKENDRYADILCATHFANSKKKLLKFNSKLTKDVMNLQMAFTAVTALGIIALIATIAVLALLVVDRPEKIDSFQEAESKFKESELSLQKLREKQEALPKDIGTKVEFLSIDSKMPKMKDIAILTVYKSARNLPRNVSIKDIEIKFSDFTFEEKKNDEFSEGLYGEGAYNDPFATRAKKAPVPAELSKGVKHSYAGIMNVIVSIRRSELDILSDIADDILKDMNDNQYGNVFAYKTAPKSTQNNAIETVTNREDAKLNEIVEIPAEIEFKGTVSEEE